MATKFIKDPQELTEILNSPMLETAVLETAGFHHHKQRVLRFLRRDDRPTFWAHTEGLYKGIYNKGILVACHKGDNIAADLIRYGSEWGEDCVVVGSVNPFQAHYLYANGSKESLNAVKLAFDSEAASWHAHTEVYWTRGRNKGKSKFFAYI